MWVVVSQSIPGQASELRKIATGILGVHVHRLPSSSRRHAPRVTQASTAHALSIGRRGCSMLPEALVIAGFHGDVDVIEEWLRDGDVNAQVVDGGWGVLHGSTLLHLAVCAANDAESAAKILPTLLAAGPDVDARNSNGDTPLHVAARNDKMPPNFGALFLDHGADIDARNSKGYTPLMIVNGNPVVKKKVHRVWVSLLVARGARVDLRDHLGLDALDYAEAANNYAGPAISTREREREIGLSAAMIEMLYDIRAAGGTWQQFLHEPRASLDVLRALCEKGRAVAPISGPLSRLFPGNSGGGSADVSAGAELPVELFRHVLAYWRSDRDLTCDRDNRPWMFACLKRVPAHLHANAVMDDSGKIIIDVREDSRFSAARAALGLPALALRVASPPRRTTPLDTESWRDIFGGTVREGAPPGSVLIHDTAEEPATP